MKLYFKYQFIVFLYAYLRQIDLSLARGMNEPIVNIQEYYITQISPQIVLNYLKNNAKNDKELNVGLNLINYRSSVRLKIYYILLKFLKLNNFLTKKEIRTSIDLLSLFDEILFSKVEISPKYLLELRLKIANLSTLFEYKLYCDDNEKAMSVSHYKESGYKTTNSIFIFIKDFNLK